MSQYYPSGLYYQAKFGVFNPEFIEEYDPLKGDGELKPLPGLSSSIGVSDNKRTVSWIQLLVISFFFTSGGNSFVFQVGVRAHARVLSIESAIVRLALSHVTGPFGVESTVSAGGPLFACIALFALPFFWCLPQALMSAEMSLMNDINGGNIVWYTLRKSH